MKVNDTAQGMPITPATTVVAAMNLMGHDEPPMACCPKDGEPLMSTFRFPGAEFACMVCGGLLGFLAPKARKVTPELQARHDELRAKFDGGEFPLGTQQA